jgi:choline-sulfatase
VRVPFVVAGPGVAKGQTNDAPIYLQDVIPSTLDWAGAKTPDDVQFESVQPHLAGKGKKRDYIYGAYLGVQRSLTAGGYKLIVYPKADNTVRLYHVAADPHELVDRLEKGGEEARAKAAELFEKLEAVKGEFGDTMELAKPGA